MPLVSTRAVRCRFLSLRLLLTFLFCTTGVYALNPVPASKPAAYPDWWFEYGVIPRTNPAEVSPTWPGSYLPTDNYAAINQGQLKHLATAAFDALEANVPDGAGYTISALVRSWYLLDSQGNFVTYPVTQRRQIRQGGAQEPYAVATLGQLKAVAAPFYERLQALGVAAPYPWTAASTSPDDAAVANIGQAKQLFSFPVTGIGDATSSIYRISTSRRSHTIEVHYANLPPVSLTPTLNSERLETVPTGLILYTPLKSFAASGPRRGSANWYLRDATTGEVTESYKTLDARHALDPSSPTFDEFTATKWISTPPISSPAAQGASPTSIQLSWTSTGSSRDGLFRVEWLDPGSGDWKDLTSSLVGNVTNFLDEHLLPGSTHQYRVTYLYGPNQGAPSLATGTTLGTPASAAS